MTWKKSKIDDSGTVSSISRSRPVSVKYKTEIGPVLMGWIARHSARVVNNVQVKGHGRTPYRSLHGKDYTGEVVPLREVCLGRNNHSEDGAKLNMRWMRGVVVGKHDRTNEFLLLTPTGAMRTRCVRRLQGDNAWDLQFKRMSWQVVDVRKGCSCDRTVWISTDVLQNFQVVLALDNTQRIAEQELNKKCWIEVMQLILRHVEIRKKL